MDISSISVNAVLISWPTNAPGFVLQQTTALESTNWMNAAEAVSAVGTNFQATIAITNSAQLFRLRHP
jgi:hypothetical protein